jgi:hypothetical protein
MIRVIVIVAIVLLAAGLTLAGYSAFFLGSGLAGAGALLHRYWLVLAGLGTTETTVWLIIILAALVLGWRAANMPRYGKY